MKPLEFKSLITDWYYDTLEHLISLEFGKLLINWEIGKPNA